MSLWGDNIYKLQVCNFPYIGNYTINFRTDSYNHSFRVGDHRYYSSLYLTTESSLIFNPFEMLMLMVYSIPSNDFADADIFGFFRNIDQPTIIYLEYLDQGVMYNYKLKLDKLGIIEETLHKYDEDMYKRIEFNDNRTNLASCLSLDYSLWFNRINWFSYTDYDDLINDKKIKVYDNYLKIHNYNKKNWTDYEEALVELLNIQRVYNINRITINGNNVMIYEKKRDIGIELEQYSEEFINYFLLLSVVLKTLSIDQGILIISESDNFDDIILIAIFRMFNTSDTNSNGSQLIFIGSNHLIDKLGLDNKQIYSYKIP